MLSIRLNPEIEKQLKLVAKLEGVTVSEYVRRLIVEKMEDMYDLKIAEEAYEEYEKDPVTYSLEEVKKELGL